MTGSMSERLRRIRSESRAAWYSFVRRRTAVFFTFFFPVIIIGIFGALVETNPAGGLFSEPQGFYIPGYLAVVVLLTPLSRVGSTVARHRSNRRFEKLATTPLTRFEWLAAHTLVTTVLIGLASAVILGVLVLATGARFRVTPLLGVFVVVGVVTFCGLGALLGRLADSQDGVIAVSNAVGIPMLFLAETFVTPEMLPSAFHPVIDFLPLTYFSRGVRAVTYPPASGSPMTDLGILFAVALGFFVAGGYLVPWKE
ncbi:MAG: ABC transporter permease [Halobacteria archaeon]|nr:ABC transporter permease [Halobacteria archaeon]